MINIKSDSRRVKKGDIFIALKTIEGDGHNYIKKAIENGASKIIAEHGTYEIDYEIVEDTHKYLVDYLKTHYGHIIDELNIIGITGTNGKTTTSFVIHDALNRLGKKAAYIGTIGYYIVNKKADVANTTCALDELYEMITDAYEQGCKNIVLEMSSQGMAQGRTESLKFNYAVFTNLTHDHLDFHKTMENYALAKQQLFKNLKPNGKAIVNIDDKYKDYFLLEENNNLTYGFNDADYQVIDYKMTSNDTVFTLKYKDNNYQIKTNLLGKYNVYNMLGCIAVLTEMGIDIKDTKEVLTKIKSPEGRLDLVKYKTNSILIDYAHTPDAIKNVIDTMKEVAKADIYVVFGCTGDRDRTKRPIMAKLVTDNVKKAIITNEDPHFEDPNRIINDMIKDLDNKNYEVIIDRKQAIIRGINLLKENDILLILGKGHEDAMIVKDKRIPFNDKKIVINYLEQTPIKNTF